MPVLDNPKHERFAQERARGVNQGEAYTSAGYKPSEQHASRLASNGKIAERIIEIQTKAAEKIEFTIADAMRQVDEDREFARELKQSSAAVAASALKFKLAGMLIDKVQADVTQHEVTADPETTMEAWQSLTPNRPVQGSA